VTIWLSFIRWTLRGSGYRVLLQAEQCDLMDAGAATERAIGALLGRWRDQDAADLPQVILVEPGWQERRQ